jgi:hypothetical protein
MLGWIVMKVKPLWIASPSERERMQQNNFPDSLNTTEYMTKYSLEWSHWFLKYNGMECKDQFTQETIGIATVSPEHYWT